MDAKEASAVVTTSEPPLGADARHESGRPSLAPVEGVVGMDTMPGAPPPLRMEDDARYHAFVALADEAAAGLKDAGWDNLLHIKALSLVMIRAREVISAFPSSTDRRAIAHKLVPLLPEAMRPRTFRPLPGAVAARGPEFRIYPGDVPRVAPVYTAFLARPDIIEALIVPGNDARPFLAPRGICPGAARGAATLLIVDAVIDSAGGAEARGRVPRAQIDPAAAGAPDADVRIGPDGKPLLTVDGRTQPITVPVDTLAAWLFSAGPDARGLDLRSADDRALLLTFAHALRSCDVRGRSAFAWLEDGGAPLDVRVEVVDAVVNAAVRVVADHTLDPLAARLTLRADGGDGNWQRDAAAILDDIGLFRRVVPRHAPAAPHDVDADIVWAHGVLPPGFAAGRLSALAAGRTFARLATSMLAPLGVLPMSGLRDGSGDVVLQALVPTADGDRTVRATAPRLVSFAEGDAPLPRGSVRPLVDAWHVGDGLLLPEPKTGPRHDVAAMPAWLAFFLEGLS